MKTFRMIGMAVVAIIISMTLVSCDDDDDDDYYDPGTGGPVPTEQDYMNIANTRWQIVDMDEKDLDFGAGYYIDFYDTNTTGAIFSGSDTYGFDYLEISELTLEIGFGDGTMSGIFQYTSTDEKAAVYQYNWTDSPNETYSMTLSWVEDF